MKMPKEIYNSMKNDFKEVINKTGFDFVNADHGKTGLRVMYLILNKISHDRAYDNSHPGFKQGAWKRILPYDGRKFCFYYVEGCNDTHVATALKNIKKELEASQ